ncbi:unnamed protein product [Moneuplotes crassus]|uniref:Checkpoint protein n=1 Tax=Euplotes crassus TaxID=5936 RepID=A0AAD1XM31_EUPCR|nr:unnamed protein product [Moneuplotes crassus]
MRLNFTISSTNAIALAKMLSYAKNLWKKGELIYLYCKDDSIQFYPDPGDISDNIYGKIELYPITKEDDPDRLGFMKEFEIKSKAPESKILLCFHNFGQFFDVIRSFSAYGNDISFSLKKEVDREVEIFRVRCKSDNSDDEIFDKVQVEVCQYELDTKSPKEIKQKETMIILNEMETSIFFTNFYEKISTLFPLFAHSEYNGDCVALTFSILEPEDEEKTSLQITLDMGGYESKNEIKVPKIDDALHPSVIKISDDYNLGDEISTKVGYAHFLKMFKIVRCKGTMMIEITDQDSIALNYDFEDCKSAKIYVTCTGVIE